MFKKSILVIAISRTKLVAAEVDRLKKSVGKTIILAWEDETLELALGQVKEKFAHRNVRILLSRDLSYVLKINIPLDLNDNEEREYISSEVNSKIPEFISDEYWDYKDLHFGKALENTIDGKNKEVIVFSPVKGFFDLLSTSIVNVGLNVDAIEPEDVAVTRNINPVVGIALKDDIKGKDSDVLNLKPLAISDLKSRADVTQDDTILLDELQEGSPERLIDSKVKVNFPRIIKKRTNIAKIVLFIILFITFIAGLIFGLYKYGLFGKFVNSTNDISDIPIAQTDQITNNYVAEEVQKETAEEIEIIIPDAQEYKLLLQNGSGIKGEAAYVSQLLSDINFGSVDSGNADNYLYSETLIKRKSDFPQSLIKLIRQYLEDEYLVDDSESNLTDDFEYDIVIIIGNKNS